MSGNQEITEVVAEGVSIAKAAELCDGILAEGNAIPCVVPTQDGLFTVTARAYSGGFRPYTRWPMRKIDYTLRFRVTRPYKKPLVTPFMYPSKREDYDEYIGQKAYDTYTRLEEEALERQKEHEENYEITMEHIKEKLGEKPDVTQAVPEEAVRNTIDSILRRGFFINPDDEDEERKGHYAR